MFAAVAIFFFALAAVPVILEEGDISAGFDLLSDLVEDVRGPVSVSTSNSPPAAAPMPAPQSREVASRTIDNLSGGVLSVAAPGSALNGLRVHVPPGALGSSSSIDLRLGEIETPRDLHLPGVVQEDPSVIFQLARILVEANTRAGRELYHPALAPILMLSAGGESAFPAFTLEPSGYSFSKPITISLPPSTVDWNDPPRPEMVTVLLRTGDPSGQATWEVVRDITVDPTSRTISFQVSHLSGFWSSVYTNTFPLLTDPKVRNRAVESSKIVLYLIGRHAGVDPLLESSRQNLPQDTFERFVTQIVCSGKKPFVPAVDSSGFPSQSDLLKSLAYDGDRAVSFPQEEIQLRDWLRNSNPRVANAAHPRLPESIGIDELFGKALEMTNGNVFKALMVCHNTLRLIPRKGVEENMLAPYRLDGRDQTGARYHIFGTAAYSFAYQHWYREDPARGWFPPEGVVSFEEALWSQDIVSDNVEFAVDLQGIEIGRQLYAQVLDKDVDQLAREYRIDPLHECGREPATDAPADTTPQDMPTGGEWTALGWLKDTVPGATNEVRLSFDLSGGPVRGDVRVAYDEKPLPQCPALKMGMELNLTGSHTGNSMSGTYDGFQAGYLGYDWIAGAGGCPDIASVLVSGTWKASLEGTSLEGEIIVDIGDGAAAGRYVQPFEARVIR